MRKEAPFADADTALSLIFRLLDDVSPPENPGSPYVTKKSIVNRVSSSRGLEIGDVAGVRCSVTRVIPYTFN
jgi:hypothetical protein